MLARSVNEKTEIPGFFVILNSNEVTGFAIAHIFMSIFAFLLPRVELDIQRQQKGFIKTRGNYENNVPFDRQPLIDL